MTLRHMKIFLSVFKTMNITKAAENLCMTQPAVTRAIKEIENYYGVYLFDRINKKLYVTESGKLFYTYALHILDSFDQLEKNLRNWEEIGTLRIGTTLTIGNVLLSKALLLFKNDYPKLNVKTTVATGNNLQKALLNNQLDFAVIEGSINNSELVTKKLANDRLILILPPNDSRRMCNNLSLHDFKNDSFILRDVGSMSRLFINNVFAIHGIQLTPTMESVSTQAIIKAVHEGLGISFLPEHLVTQAISTGFVSTSKLIDENFIRENHIVWHKHKFLTLSAKKLMEHFYNLSYKEY